jgi:hypothetical protein
MDMRIRRPSPAMIVALGALLVALSGTAMAAGIVPLAKRALIADNAKKLQGKTSAQLTVPVAGRVALRTAAWSLNPGGSSDFAAACNPGEKVVGGGYDHSSGDVLSLDNRPAADGSGWKVSLESLSPTNATAGTIYAICVS